MLLSVVLVQPRKTRPCLTERLLMGRKESNQTNKRTRSMDQDLAVVKGSYDSFPVKQSVAVNMI